MTITVRIITDEWYPVYDMFKHTEDTKKLKTYQVSEYLFDRYVKSIEEFYEVQEELRKIVDKDD